MDEITQECPECGAENEATANVCVDCGADLSVADDVDDDDGGWEPMEGDDEGEDEDDAWEDDGDDEDDEW